MKKILVVEDDLNVRDLERNILESQGYEVVEAGNAKDGIRLALEEKPDLIIMDIRLPSKKRGIGAAKIIRNDPKTKDIPIVFVTGYVGGDQTGEIASISKSSYLLKPFEIEGLIKHIEQFF